MPRTARDVVFVDGVRTPFGKAGPNGLYAETRADDMVVSVIRELLRRNPALPPERIGEVAIAATTQTGDQGLTIGRSAAVLAGLPKSVPGYAAELGLDARLRLVDFAFAGVDPEVMGIGPVPATEAVLARNDLTMDDIGLIEINEAFAVQVLAFLDHFKIADDDPRVNPWGGAIALGHPLASSGVRLMIQLARQFAGQPDVRYGLTTMCVGLGMGGTVLWENSNA